MNLWFAPNPRRVAIYIVEKGLKVRHVLHDAEARAHKDPSFLAKNPAGKLPVLELSTGEYILDSAAIVEYLEERYPDPNLIGTTPVDRAKVRAFERMTTDLLWLSAGVLRNSHPYFESWGAPKNPGAVNYALPRFQQLVRSVDTLIGDQEFAVGDRVTIADCTLCAAYDFAFTFGEIEPDSKLGNLDRWYASFSQRPSAKANCDTLDTLMREPA